MLACDNKCRGFKSSGCEKYFLDIGCRNGLRCRYQNDSFQSDIFSSDIGITDVNVGCQILLTLRSMSVPTYEYAL